jgi:hypothetical protein
VSRRGGTTQKRPAAFKDFAIGEGGAEGGDLFGTTTGEKHQLMGIVKALTGRYHFIDGFACGIDHLRKTTALGAGKV